MNRRRILAFTSASVVAGALMLSLSSPAIVSAATSPTTVTASKSADGATPAPGRDGRRGGFFGGATLDAAAKALGMTTDALTKELAAGKSIADVAAAKKVSVDIVVNAIQAAMRPQIVDLVNAKGLQGPGFGGPGDHDDHDGQGGKGAKGGSGGNGGGSGSSQGATGEALKTCLKGKGIDPSKVPTDQAAKDARAKALKECIKSAAPA